MWMISDQDTLHYLIGVAGYGYSALKHQALIFIFNARLGEEERDLTFCFLLCAHTHGLIGPS